MAHKEKWSEVTYLLLYKWRIAIIVSLLLVPLGVIAVKRIQPKRFEAAASLLVVPRNEKGDPISSAFSLETYSEIAMSDVMLERVEKEAAGRFAWPGDISFACQLNVMKHGGGVSGLSPIVKLRATSVDSTHLGDIVALWADEFLSYSGELHFSLNTDVNEYLSRQASLLRTSLDSLSVVIREVNEQNRLDFKLKELDGTKEALDTEVAKRQKMQHDVETEQIQLNNVTELARSVEVLDDERLRKVHTAYTALREAKSALAIEQKVSTDRHELATKVDKLYESRKKLLEYNYEKRILDNRLETLDSMMTLLPQTIAATRMLESVDTHRKATLVKTENPNPMYVQFNNEAAEVRKALLTLEKERALAQQVIDAYKRGIDSLGSAQHVRDVEQRLLEHDFALLKDREEWRIALIDSLTRQADRLRVSVTQQKAYLDKMAPRIDSLEKDYFALNKHVGTLAVKRDDLKQQRQRLEEEYALVTKKISQSRYGGNMDLANLRVLSDEVYAKAMESLSATNYAFASVFITAMLWFALAVVVVGLKPELESAKVKSKVDRFVNDVSDSKVKKGEQGQ